MGAKEAPNFIFWKAHSVLFVSRWVVIVWSNVVIDVHLVGKIISQGR